MFDLSLVDPGRADDFFSVLSGLSFNESRAQFDPINALWLAEFSRLIYRRSNEVASHSGPSRMDFLRPQGLTESEFFTDGKTQAALIESERFSVLVFRGTEPQRLREDFFTDARFRLRTWDGPGEVHTGFRDAFESVWSQMKDRNVVLKPPLFITGHSLGGALAALATARCRSQNIPVVATYTFGAPRVGSESFAIASATSALYRVVNDRDIAPRLPPFLIGYRHTSKLAKIDHSGTLHFHDNFEDHIDFELSILPVEDILDHHPASYVTVLRHAISGR